MIFHKPIHFLVFLLGFIFSLNHQSIAQSSTADELQELLKLQTEFMKKSDVLMKAGKYKEAIKLGNKYKEIMNVETFRIESRKLHNQGNYQEAAKIARKAVAQAEKIYSNKHRKYALALSVLSVIYQTQGYYSKAEPIAQQALEIFQTQNDKLLGRTLQGLADIYRAQGRYIKAEKFYKLALTDAEKKLGFEDEEVGQIINNLAFLYSKNIENYDEAEKLFKRAYNLFEKKVNSSAILKFRNTGHFTATIANLGDLYRKQGRYDLAESFIRKSLSLNEKRFGKNHPYLGTDFYNLSNLYKNLKKYSEAEKFIRQATEIEIKSYGKDHRYIADNLHTLADLYHIQKKYSEAEKSYLESMRIRKNVYGERHPIFAETINDLGKLYFAEKNWKDSYKLLKEGTDVYSQHTKQANSKKQFGKKKNTTHKQSSSYKNLIKAAYRLSEQDSREKKPITYETFLKAQWVNGAGASSALSQMAARFSKGNGKLAQLIRERQDKQSEWQALDKELIAVKSQKQKQRNIETENQIQQHLLKLESRITQIDNILKKEFPEYIALANPAPLSIQDAQAQLQGDEVLVYFVDTAELENATEETFIWFISKTDVKWIRSSLGSKSLDTAVKTLRCGLDSESWINEKKVQDCNKLLDTNFKYNDYLKGQPLPLNTTLSHKLYQEFFGDVKDIIHNKKLLLVPSGPLTSLPFQILLTEPPKPGTNYQDMKWIINDHDITILPSVSSLKALRRTLKPSAATHQYLGIGNPLLSGPKETDKSAWNKQNCNFNEATKTIKVAKWDSIENITKFFSRGQVNLTLLKRQHPLPETADELCAVAQVLGASEKSVVLGAKATEGNIKKFSNVGMLKQMKIIHFATHGLLAGETESLIKNQAEPSLLLTPPNKASNFDDGLLTASEITQLKLDADWVILSACNTAGGEKPGAEAMSGLARAFFYSGARALLVSHWYVDSNATVALITKSFEALKKRPQLGRSGALRVAIQDLIKSKQYSHPEYWAPFIVVGEGAKLQ